MSADHDDGALRVMHAVLADRAEQRLGEAAVPAAAHHQEVGAVGGFEQHLSGIALDDAGSTGTSLLGSTAALIASEMTFSEFSLKSNPPPVPIGANP